MASAMPNRTAALSDMGTLIMLASSIMARRALFLVSELSFSIFFFFLSSSYVKVKLHFAIEPLVLVFMVLRLMLRVVHMKWNVMLMFFFRL